MVASDPQRWGVVALTTRPVAHGNSSSMHKQESTRAGADATVRSTGPQASRACAAISAIVEERSEALGARLNFRIPVGFEEFERAVAPSLMRYWSALAQLQWGEAHGPVTLEWTRGDLEALVDWLVESESVFDVKLGSVILGQSGRDVTGHESLLALI